MEKITEIFTNWIRMFEIADDQNESMFAIMMFLTIATCA
jgi:hypothetical protein